MRVLVVEDEASVVSAIQEGLDGDVELVVADSRDTAVDLLNRDGQFDLIVCDLRIPPASGEGLLANEEHGLAVFAACRERLPGTPIRFFSGRANLDNLASALSTSGPADLLGDGTTWPLVHVHQKRDAADFMDELGRINKGLKVLENSVQIECEEPLEGTTMRALRILARRVDATTALVRPAGSHAPGLSGADTLAVQFVDDEGVTRARNFVKASTHGRIAQELDAFDRFVPTLLPTGFTPRGSVLEHGLRGRSAIAYVLAEGFDDNLFTLLARSESLALEALERLIQLLEPWKPVWRRERITVAAMRRELATDDQIAMREWALPFQTYEDSEVSLPLSVCHGDLHGGNVLVRPNGEPIMIDFGDVALGWPTFDPVTLELSLVFHPASPLKSSGWPSSDVAADYRNLDRYLEECPVPEFVRRIREWAVERAASDDATLRAVVYCQAIRQLKYPDTDHTVATAFARGSI